MLLEHTVHDNKTEFSERRVGHSHHLDTVLALVGSRRLHELLFMSLRNGAEPIFDVIGLDDGESDFLACLTLWVEVSSGYVFPSRVVVDRDLHDVFSIALNADRLGRVRVKGRCRMKSRRAACSAHCLRVRRVEAAGQQVAQDFWDIVSSEEVVRITESLELLVHSR